jgi:hypothetical protein
MLPDGHAKETFMERSEPQIFVLDVIDKRAFAFEADSVAQAEELVRAPRFTAALDGFCSRKGEARTHASCLTRPATEAEASIYRDFASEFADASGRILVAHLPGRLTEH